MNYLAHALPLMDQAEPRPYEVAGVAIPDWLGVAAKGIKCRSKHAEPFAEDSDRRLAEVARGVMRHHADDLWFHESPTFGQLSLAFAKQLRAALGEETAMRPWFVGHILVEMLLDAELERQRPGLLDRYYGLLTQTDPSVVGAAVERMAGQPVPRLPEMIARFVEVRFLDDYLSDEGFMFRLNQVMGRVGLEALPQAMLGGLPGYRAQVATRSSELLSPPALG